jgi:hypothetical protein
MSTYAVPSTPQARQDFQYSSTVDGLLKNVYIPALNNTIFHATPLLEMFGEFGGTIDFQGNKIIKAFKYQGAGGFRGISEGGDFVTPAKQKGFQGYERLKYLNIYFELTGPAALTVQSGEGAFVSAVQSAMDDTLKLGRMNMERMVAGRCSAEVARFTSAEHTETAMANGEYLPAAAEATDSSYLASTHDLTALKTWGGYSGTAWLYNGLEVYLMVTADLTTALEDSNQDVVQSTEMAGPFEVEYVDHINGTFALKYTGTDALNLTDDSAAHIELGAESVSLVLSDSYGQIEDAGGTDANRCLEINGLLNLVDDGGYIWNLARSTYPNSLKSRVVDADAAELTEDYLTLILLDQVNLQQNTPNVVVTSPKAKQTYFTNVKDDRQFNTFIMDSQTGYRRLGVTIDSYSMYLETIASLPSDHLLMLNTGDFKWARATDGFKWIESGGQILRPKESSDNIFGTAVSYCNLVCENPRGQTKVEDIEYDYV